MPPHAQRNSFQTSGALYCGACINTKQTVEDEWGLCISSAIRPPVSVGLRNTIPSAISIMADIELFTPITIFLN
jgi:hypothetical protein